MLHSAKMMLGRNVAGAAALDTQQVTSGADGSAVDQERRRGFISGAIGVCVDGLSDLYGGASILELYWDQNGGTGVDFVAFTAAGIRANSGWSQMAVGLNTFVRSSATFSTAGGNSRWTWNNLGFGAAANPFGGGGTDHSVTFT